MDKQYLYNSSTYQSCLERLDKIEENTPAQWGKMNAAQMFAHCAEAQEVLNGKALGKTPFFIKIFAPFIKKLVLSEKPYRKNGPTHPKYKQLSPKNFTEEKSRLLDSLKNFVETPAQEADQNTHPLFGKLSHEEKGWASYKHLHHHLEQFGA